MGSLKINRNRLFFFFFYGSDFRHDTGLVRSRNINVLSPSAGWGALRPTSAESRSVTRVKTRNAKSSTIIDGVTQQDL